MMLAVADAIAQDADHLSRLDGAIGDGDHGVAMETGWRAIRPALQGDGDRTITEICAAMSHVFLEAVGASAGPPYASGFKEAGEAVANHLSLDATAVAAWI
jgi:dihydroxyacetone kinase